MNGETARRIAALSPEQRERLLQGLAHAGRKELPVIAPPPETPHAATEAALPPLVPHPEERWQPFPLTIVQQMYWTGRSRFFDLWAPGGNVYIEYELTSNNGAIADSIEAALDKVIAHHQILRFKVLPDGRGQLIEKLPRYHIEMVSLGRLDPAEVERRLAEIRERFHYREGPADHWPLFGILLHLLDDERSRVHLWFDCLLVDGLSRDNFWRDLFQVIRDPETPLSPLEITYRDYAVAWEEIRAGQAYRQARERWLARIETLPPPLDLPLTAPIGPTTRSLLGVEGQRVVLPAAAWLRLKERAARLEVTPSSLLIAVFIEVLRTWSTRPRFFFSLEGTHWPPIHPQIRAILGNFNTIYIVTADDLAGSFEDRLRRLHAQMTQILEDRLFSGFEVLREIRRKLGGGTRALSPVMFNSLVEFRHASYQDLRPAELSGRPPVDGIPDDDAIRVQSIEEVAFMPQILLLTTMNEGDDGSLLCNQVRNEPALAPGAPDDLRATMVVLLERLADDEKSWQCSHFRLAPAAHLAARPARTAPRPAEMTLVELFAARAAERRNAPAVAWAGGSVTYGGLVDRAQDLAHRLQAQGAGPGDAVAVVLDGSWRQAAAVLGTLGSGAACLLLDGSLSPAHHAATLRHSGARFAIGDKREDTEGVCWLAVKDDLPADAPAEPFPAPGDIAYLTGDVKVQHRAAATAFLDLNQRLDLTPEDRVLGLSPPGSDFTLYEMLGPLAAGATVVLPGSGGDATVWSGPPALLEQALARRHAGELPPPRLVLISRDTVPLSLPNRLRAAAPGLRVLAAAGLPETPAAFAVHVVDQVPVDAVRIPAGRPIGGFTLHVLDHALEPRPDWVPGDLYIGGSCLARDNAAHGDGTAGRFLLHPQTGERLLRTGLSARFLPEGVLDVLGRTGAWSADRFGYPVELRRIEAALERHPSVRAAVAQAGNGTAPHAWVVPVPGTAIDPTQLADHLAARIPSYMVPASIEALAELPLDRTGAVDRDALLPAPAPSLPLRPDPIPPSDPLEEELARDWCELLELDSIGVNENFFEAGGDSFRAVLLLDRLRTRFEDPGDLTAFFYEPTIQALARRVRDKERTVPATTSASIFHRLTGLLLRRSAPTPASPAKQAREGQPKSPSALREMRPFLTLWLGQLVSTLGTSLGSFSFGVWVVEKTGSTTPFAMIAVIAGIVSLVLAPISGALADRWDRRKLMLFSDVGSALMTMAIASLMFTDRLALWHIYIFVAIMVSLSALQGPALTSSISLLVPRRHLARAAGMSQISRASAAIIGPFAAGLLVSVVGYHGVIYLDCVTFLFGAATLLLVPIPNPPRTVAHFSILRDLAVGWTYIRERRGLFALLSMYTLTNFCMGIVQVLLTPLILAFATPAELGSVNSVAAGGILLGSLTLSLWGGPRNRIWAIFAVLIFQGCLLFLGGVQPSIPLITVVMFIFMFTGPIMNGSNQSILQAKVAPEVQGRVFGMAGFIVACSLPLASAIAGPLVDRVFQPALSPGGALAATFVGRLIGVGPGRGAGLLFVLVGIAVLIIVGFAFLNPRLRRLETELPDAVRQTPRLTGAQ